LGTKFSSPVFTRILDCFFIILGSLPPYPLDMYKYKKNRGAFIQTTLLGSQEYLMRVIKRTRPQYFQRL
jgi:hypothetical protein